jgi:hypothetical protein
MSAFPKTRTAAGYIARHGPGSAMRQRRDGRIHR